MTRRLLLSAGPGEVRGALVEHGRAIDYIVERRRGGTRVGNVFLGRIVAVLPAMPGYLVDIGEDRPAFLDAGQAGPGALHEGQTVVVQAVRDPQAAKATNVTARVVFDGARLSYDPTRAGVRSSRRLDEAERARLEALLAGIARPDESFVLRPSAAGAAAETLAAEAAALRARWQIVEERARSLDPPALLAAATEPAIRVLDEFATAEWGEVVVDSRAVYATARRWLGERRPELRDALRLHDGEPVFDAFNVADDLARLVELDVPLAKGGRLTIEPTAAATVIDVDTAGAVGAGAGRGDPRRAALAINLAAAREAARQIRLRNLAGAVVIDFVSMKRRSDRDNVLAALTAAVVGDPAEPQILGWTRLGHVEVIRRRRRRPLAELLMERCAPWAPTAETIALEILRRAAWEARRVPGGVPSVVVSSEVAAALGRGETADARAELEAELHRPLSVIADSSFPRDAFDIRLV